MWKKKKNFPIVVFFDLIQALEFSCSAEDCVFESLRVDILVCELFQSVLIFGAFVLCDFVRCEPRFGFVRVFGS